jgi:DNA-binding GntR family transcriptional regulator
MATPARDAIRDQIENAILTGELAPGQRLDEVTLAERAGVSRTPIREVLMQLAALGLVEFGPRRGAIVARIAPERLVEMFELMAELEAMAVRLSARRHTDADAADIRAAHAACAEAAESRDADRYYYANERFHQALYAASHQGFLIEQCQLLHRRLKPYRRLQLRVRQRMASSLTEHGAIMEAVLGLDGERAADLMRQHVLVQGERFTDLLASLRPALSA